MGAKGSPSKLRPGKIHRLANCVSCGAEIFLNGPAHRFCRKCAAEQWQVYMTRAKLKHWERYYMDGEYRKKTQLAIRRAYLLNKIRRDPTKAIQRLLGVQEHDLSGD